jgi:hypothetical protein
MEFTLKANLKKHLMNNKCKVKNFVSLHEKLEKLVMNNSIDNSINIDNSVNMNIKIELNINPVTKLEMSHITPEHMRTLIEEYDIKPEKAGLLLGDYVKDLICDPEHPENHIVKYIKKNPSTFSSVIEDRDGNKINVIKGLKETCELLSDPILDALKIKLREFLRKYKKNDDFNYLIYEETIKELKYEFTKPNIKKVLSSVLQNDILNNIEMKLTIENAK